MGHRGRDDNVAFVITPYILTSPTGLEHRQQPFAEGHFHGVAVFKNVVADTVLRKVGIQILGACLLKYGESNDDK